MPLERQLGRADRPVGFVLSATNHVPEAFPEEEENFVLGSFGDFGTAEFFNSGRLLAAVAQQHIFDTVDFYMRYSRNYIMVAVLCIYPSHRVKTDRCVCGFA